MSTKDNNAQWTSGLHLYKTYLDALHGSEQEAWDFPQDGLLVGSEEKTGKAC